MERKEDTIESTGRPSPAMVGGSAAPRSGSLRARVLTVTMITLGVLVSMAALDLVTTSPRLCSSCHEMAPRADSWRRSAHSEIPCVSCHQPPRSRYALPQRLLDRGRLLGHDVARHITGDYQDPVDERVSGTAPLSDDVCLQCHDPNRKATSGFRILIDHAAHARRTGSCVSCHVRTAHPVKTRGKALSLMAQCFTCHGTTKTVEARAECTVCHPSGYTLLPASHKAAKWGKRHGSTARSDERQCRMCHVESFCNDCHRLEMPHPKGWAKGRTGHAGIAEQRREICARCHGNRPDMCTICHHKAYESTKGTWLRQHSLDAIKNGVLVCLECHGPTYCSRCHRGKN